MSRLLGFLGLTQKQPKHGYNRTPLTLADVLHRTLVTSLAALSIYGIYLGYSVHDHVMSKGKVPFPAFPLSTRMAAYDILPEVLALKEAEAKARKEAEQVEEARERSLAEAAQAALPKQRSL